MDTTSHSVSEHSHETHTHHVSPVSMYLTIFGALLVLMVLTIAVWFVHLGGFGTIIAMGIALTKAVLVVLFFMHVKDASRLTWIFAGAAFVWLMILFAFTFNDYWTRGVAPHETDLTHNPRIAAQEPAFEQTRTPHPAVAPHESLTEPTN